MRSDLRRAGHEREHLEPVGQAQAEPQTGTWGIRTGQKRAIVTLAEGDRIEIFGS